MSVKGKLLTEYSVTCASCEWYRQEWGPRKRAIDQFLLEGWRKIENKGWTCPGCLENTLNLQPRSVQAEGKDIHQISRASKWCGRCASNYLGSAHSKLCGSCKKKRGPAKTNREDVIGHLKAAALHYGGELSIPQYIEYRKQHGGLSAGTVTQLVGNGSWLGVCKALDIKPAKRRRKKNDPIPKFRETLLTLGYIPLYNNYRSSPSIATLYLCGYSYTAAVAAAGFDYALSKKEKKLIPLPEAER